MHPLADYAEKKSIFPTMLMSLFDIIVDHCKDIQEGTKEVPLVSGSNGYPVKLFRGQSVEKLESFNPKKNFYYACPAYIVKADSFDYAKKTRTALKIIVDSDGYISERVIWPDYDTGILKDYPGLEKGAICLLFLKRRPDKENTQITDVKILLSPLKKSKK